MPDYELVTDELQFMSRILPLADARVLEIGCGDGSFSRRMRKEGGAGSICALEVEEDRIRRNIEAGVPEGVTFATGRAEQLPFADCAFDLVIMLKSLHHVPVDQMDIAMQEIRRVLRPDGLLYVSEPVFAGDFNEVMRLFHDEEYVRNEAIAAMQRAAAAKVLDPVAEYFFMAPVAFRSIEDFDRRMLDLPWLEVEITPELRERIHAKLQSFASDKGFYFERLVRVNVMRR